MGLFNKKIKKDTFIDMERLPTHVAIIPDGNRRWARRRGLSPVFGHREGAKRMREIIDYAYKTGIKHISFFVFSTENWTRTGKEVEDLMDLIHEFLIKAEKELEGKDIRMNIVGEREMLSEKIKRDIDRIEEKTRNNSGTNLNLFLNYGGRQEILHAVNDIYRRMAAGGPAGEEIGEDILRKSLYAPHIPDPDMIIRTSSELRISNFMLWQCAYSELFFPEKFWPDFTVKEFEKTIMEYQNRNRRYGGQ